MSGVRVDKWLWAVRAYKTRSAANEACSSGRVLVNGDVAKPATKVVIGDEVTARRRERTIVYGVVQLLEKRVSAAKAAEAVDDRSPVVVKPDRLDPGMVPSGTRGRGEGRPTKRDRRRLDEFRGR
ncbi:MAG: S4 domain-containing protein [Actinomycetota bacterium]